MGNEIKTSCINPCCTAVAYIRENGRGDDYFTCSKCGPYNGKGKAFREWMAKLREQNEKPEPVEVPPGQTSEESQGDADKQEDWLERL